MKYGEIKHFARQLRNNPTPAEAKLWEHLKNRQLNGRKFLRQHPLLYDFNKSEYFYFIPDFYCYQELLIIELDGPIHDIQVDRDKNRQEILVHTGFRMIRFRNEELNDMKKVLNRIVGCFRD
ncbi:MAG: endonuclease domain-containing protein [Bacteroidota bacterium]|nr:endonuclease domain-containing protein [Bacteroidota bacterium]